jgi:hypothetical protein
MTFSIFFDNSLKNQLCQVFVPYCLPVCFAAAWYIDTKLLRNKQVKNMKKTRNCPGSLKRQECEMKANSLDYQPDFAFYFLGEKGVKNDII